MVITMAKLRMAHAGTHGARKPPGPKVIQFPLTQYMVKILSNAIHSCEEEKTMKRNFYIEYDFTG